MSDSEKRLEGARFFLERARKTSINEDHYKWYIQATASFTIAALEIMYYEYGVNNGLFDWGSRHDLKELKEKYKDEKDNAFFGWLFQKLEMNVLPRDKRSLDCRRYAFLRDERNSIFHQGERDKKIVENEMFFDGWNSEPCALMSEKTIAFVQSIIAEAKESGYV